MKKTTLLSLLLILAIASRAFSQTYVTQVKPAGEKKWGYANLKGELIIPAQYEKCYEFSSSGLAPIYQSKGREYYFINLKGERLDTEVKGFKLIDGFGFNLKGFEDGLVPVKVGDKWGFLNTAGKLAIPAKYDDATDFNGGYVPVKSGDKYLVLNTKGEETAVEGSGILDVKTFSESLAPFRAADKQFGFIDQEGKIAIQAQFESVGYFHNGLAWAKTADKTVGFIDKKGEWVIKPTFTVAKDFEAESGLARIKTGDTWGYVSKTGEVVSAGDTDIFEDFSDGLARGRKDGKFGFLDSKGSWVIEPQFDGSRDFKNGYAAVKKGERWGVIDKTGRWVIEPSFDGIKDMELVK
ncbi:MAG: WG repeat-containing protein [Cyclobacteriaceae bacterium]|nr:WG repeat-containing protein [Cyclobacteriaceae bacterium]MDH4296052.1 WG repeat-containing protein [Cyclobacteriaceae bacterium]MDH5248322.1 WG repeat-containing protein [Cyclobacteriaceae bacterium]